jgi:hypothetical protein
MINTTTSTSGNIIVLGIGLLAVGCSLYMSRRAATPSAPQNAYSTSERPLIPWPEEPSDGFVCTEAGWDAPVPTAEAELYTEIEVEEDIKPAIDKEKLWASIDQHYTAHKKAPSAIELWTTKELYEIFRGFRVFVDSHSEKIERAVRVRMCNKVSQIAHDTVDIEKTKGAIEQMLSSYFTEEEITRFLEQFT